MVQNVMGSACLKLIDFGDARIVYNDNYIHEYAGSAEFRAPEVIRGQAVSTLTDIWYTHVVCSFFCFFIMRKNKIRLIYINYFISFISYLFFKNFTYFLYFLEWFFYSISQFVTFKLILRRPMFDYSQECWRHPVCSAEWRVAIPWWKPRRNLRKHCQKRLLFSGRIFLRNFQRSHRSNQSYVGRPYSVSWKKYSTVCADILTF